jgi:hypothetical protein
MSASVINYMLESIFHVNIESETPKWRYFAIDLKMYISCELIYFLQCIAKQVLLNFYCAVDMNISHCFC